LLLLAFARKNPLPLPACFSFVPVLAHKATDLLLILIPINGILILSQVLSKAGSLKLQHLEGRLDILNAVLVDGLVHVHRDQVLQ
jgi:hypothetical protein